MLPEFTGIWGGVCTPSSGMLGSSHFLSFLSRPGAFVRQLGGRRWSCIFLKYILFLVSAPSSLLRCIGIANFDMII